MKSTDQDETKALREYWEGMRLKWVESPYEKEFGYRTYKKRLLKSLDSTRTALEIGFGDGRWIEFLKTRGVTAYGIDILENAAFHVKNEFSPVVADARFIPFKENIFDLTYSFGVVEHFEDTEKAIKEHIRVTKPGGKIIITVPYLISPHTVYLMLIHMKRGTFKRRPATFGKRYTLGGFRKILQKFDVISIKIDPFLFPIPKFKVYHENPLLDRVGSMIWAEMVKL